MATTRSRARRNPAPAPANQAQRWPDLRASAAGSSKRGTSAGNRRTREPDRPDGGHSGEDLARDQEWPRAVTSAARAVRAHAPAARRTPQRLGHDDRAVLRPGSSPGSRSSPRAVTAVPFSVWTCSSLPVAAEADVEPARLEVGRVRRRRDLAVALLRREPRLDVVLLHRRRAEVAGGDVDHAVREAELLRRAPPRSRAGARARRATPRASQKTNISTLSNWWTRNMPRVSLPAAPASRRKHVE